MATYLNADYFPEQKLFVPDFDLIAKGLQVRQARYDQGFSRVKSLYNSVLNSKATNPEDVEKQAQYLKDIENNLKDLPNVDLSLPQNVNSASSIFEPFFDDKELQHDIGVTKLSGQQLSLGQSFLQSDDVKKRAMHSSISDEFVTIPLDELRRAKRGDGSITNVKPRYYVPAVDLTDKFDKYLNSGKLKVIQQTRDGKGAIFERVNGKLIEQPLKYLLDGMITGDERKYFDAWGEVIQNRSINEKMAQGLSEADARTQIGVDLATKTKELYNEELQNFKSAYERANTAWNSYYNANVKDGKIAQTDDAVALRSNMLFYKKQMEDYQKRLGLFDFDKTAQEYTRLGKNYWSETLYNQALNKIVMGYAGSTEESTVKEDATFFKWLDIQEKRLDRESKERIAQTRIDAANSGGGFTFGVNPETGAIEMIPAADKSKSSKKTGVSTELTDLQKANMPKRSILQEVPSNTALGVIQRLDGHRKYLEGRVDAGSFSFMEKALRKDFPEMNLFIDNVLKQQKLYGISSNKKAPNRDNAEEWTSQGDMAIESPEYKKFKGLISNPNAAVGTPEGLREQAMKNFVVKYGAEFEKWVQANAKDKRPTYANMYSFLFGKSSDYMNNNKGSMPFTEWDKLRVDLENINNSTDLLNKVDTDIKSLSNKLLDPGNPNKPGGMDPLMVVKDPIHGDYRVRTKDEVKAAMDDASRVIRVDVERMPTGDGKFSTVRIPVIKSPELAKAYNKLWNNYDNIVKKFNDGISETDITGVIGEQYNLSQYYGYTLEALPDLKGENAEIAIDQLLRLGTREVTMPKVDEDPNKTTIDYSSILPKDYDLEDFNDDEDGVKGATNKALGTLLNSFATSDKMHQVLYEPFSGVQGDDRYKYTIRFNDEYLKSRISDLRTAQKSETSDGANAIGKEIEVLQN